jgi:hypothetical protein
MIAAIVDSCVGEGKIKCEIFKPLFSEILLLNFEDLDRPGKS